MDKFNFDDKDLVITATLILGIVAMFTLPPADSPGVVSSIITGLFGIAVGKSVK